MRNETIVLHAGYDTDPTTKSVTVPIYQTVAYEFDSAEHGAALFNLEVDGFRYSRISNPTTNVLERRVSALERGVGALAVSSGQAALHYAVLNVIAPGTNIVSVPQLYGTTHTLFAHLLPQMGTTVRFAPNDTPAAIEALIDDDTRAVFCESVGNPAGNICDVEALAAVAHRHGVPLIVDNTVATPILLRPIEFGADIVVHSLTKFMGGHGTTMGGIIVDSGNFPWLRHAKKFSMFTEPDKSYHDLVYTTHFGAGAYSGRWRSVYQRTLGSVLSPLSAFLLLQGIETVAVRVDRHVENAKRVAEYLRDDPRVDWVAYAGFSDSPYYALTQKYLGGRACSLMTFGVQGGYESGTRFYDALQLIKRLVNLGDAKSLACHPASTTHRQMSAAEQENAGVKPGDDPPQHRHRTRGRHHRRSRSRARRGGGAAMKDNGRSGLAADTARENPPVVVGVVNNMPDSALESTERQFRELLTAAAGTRPIRLRLFSIPERPRGEAARAYTAARYEDIGELGSDHLDGLIVTGAEPRTAILTDEPYWPALAKLVDWADDHTTSTVWSCLAAHAAVYHLSGVNRESVGEKLSGLFECEKVIDHAVTAGMPPRWRMPHSRSNTVPAGALAAAGYEFLSRSAGAGTDMFVREGKSLFLFVQGHPEYDPGALLREYQRDVGRFLSGERDQYPDVPGRLFQRREHWRTFAGRFRERALANRDVALAGAFPSAVKARLVHSWRGPATQLYSNWLSCLLRARCAV